MYVIAIMDVPINFASAEQSLSAEGRLLLKKIFFSGEFSAISPAKLDFVRSGNVSMDFLLLLDFLPRFVPYSWMRIVIAERITVWICI